MSFIIKHLITFFVILFFLQVYAQDANDIRINSYLNEPLDAEIYFLPPNSINSLDIDFRIASKEIYDFYGINRPTFLEEIIVSAVPSADEDGIVIKIISDDPITERSLHLLIEIISNGDSSFKGYTLLLDTPILDEQYFVQSGDTLWSIAFRFRPDIELTMSQMMLAILEENPKKFNNNINALYANIGLRIPNIEEIITIDPDEALSEVRYQHLLWNQQYTSISSAIDKSGMEEIDVNLSDQNDEGYNESDGKVVSRDSLDTQIEEDFPDVVVESEIIINEAPIEEESSYIDVQNSSIMEVASIQNNEVIDETLKIQDNLPAKNIRKNKSNLDKLTDIWESYWMLLALLLVIFIGLIVWYKSHKSKQETMTEVESSDDLRDSIKMTKIGTKLDLARAYVDMGDPKGALNILQEVLDEGNAEQIQLAKKLLNDLKR
ncbi:uncharacterized protein METZ01_LOCUS25490 [marine metagenome]|uniref:LysM domain-containing protein n=1 Tax=marine metagenome TaxID=408172 RepID=A0A381Q004_9ZZZZ